MSSREEKQGEEKVSIKTDENDSEAETEILGGSQKPTPVKVSHRRTRSASKSVKMEERDPEENDADDGSDASDHPRQLRHRRRIALSGSDDGDKARSTSDEPEERRLEDRRPRIRASKAAAEQLLHEQFRKQDELAAAADPNSVLLRKRRRSQQSSSSDDEGRARQPSRQSARTRHAAKPSEGDAQVTHPSHPSHPKMKGLDRSGRTVLARACADGDYAKVRDSLRASTKDIDIADYAGNTPLQFAALDGFIEIVDLLIKNGCDVHTANSDGDSPLIDAVENGHVEVVKRLLNAGVDPRHKNNTGDWAEDRLESVDDDNDREQLRRLLTEAAERNDDPIPTKTFNKTNDESGEINEERRRGDNRLLYVQPSIAKLREGAKKNDASMVLHCLESGVKPDNSSLVAAARAGHTNICNLLLAYGSKADPDPGQVGDATPMLAVIGRGLPDVIELLLSQEFNVDRKVLKGLHYWEIAEQRKGRGWKKEIQILKKQSSIPAVRASALELEARKDLTDTPTDSPTKPTHHASPRVSRFEGSPRQSDMEHHGHDLDSTTEAEEDRMEVDEEPIPAEPAPKPRTPTPEPRFKPLDISTLPTGLARALKEGSEYPINSDEAWIKSLTDWNPIVVVPLSDIEPQCPNDVAHELWMPGYQASVLLGHNQLYDVIEQHDLEVKPMTENHRRQMWNPNTLSIEYNWLDHPDKDYVRQNCPHAVYQTHPDRPRQLVINWTRSHNKQREKWLAIPDDHVFWLRLDDFIKLIDPKRTPRLKDFHTFTFVKRLEKEQTPSQAGSLPGSQAYQNGLLVPKAINGIVMDLVRQNMAQVAVAYRKRDAGNGVTVEVTEIRNGS